MAKGGKNSALTKAFFEIAARDFSHLDERGPEGKRSYYLEILEFEARLIQLTKEFSSDTKQTPEIVGDKTIPVIPLTEE